MKPLTIVIAEHNEGTQLNDTLDSILNTSDDKLYEIIVVSDNSNVALDLSKYGSIVKHTRNTIRMGVGASLDTGALQAETPHLIVMGSDIRFEKNGYVEKMLDILEDNKKSLVCTTNIGINATRMEMDHPKATRRYGARILFFMKMEDLPRNSKSRVPDYRNILEAKWIPRQEGSVRDLPCILGAFYGVTRDWYKHIKGFRGHRYWGTLEPYISLKSWFAGGDCLIANDIEVAHIFKQRPSHVTQQHDLLYNKVFISEVLFDREVRTKFLNFMGTNEYIERAKRMVLKDQEKVDYLKKYHKSIFTRDIHWFNERFAFKYYEDIIMEE